MEKQKKYDWQETNLALFGSDIEKKIKEASAGGERAWDGLGDSETLRVWRIEKFKVKAWPKKKYGEFHQGDSYIVFHCYKKNPDRSDALAYDIYFWIGEKSSQDEYCTAAYKTVELDHFLKDRAIQHREVMEHESSGFLALFDTVKYLEGGIETGFNKVEDEVFEPVLYQVKGIKGALILRQVKLRRDSLNSGDVFILDLGHVIYMWNGKKANAHEKLKAKSVVNGVISDRGGSAKSITLDEDQGDADAEEFWDAIPGERKLFNLITVRTYNVKGEFEAGNDSVVDVYRKQLYKLTDSGDSLKFSRVARGAKGNLINKNRLNSKDVFLLDDGFQVWIWIGSDASSRENGLAMSYAMRYIRDKDRPAFLPISRIKEGEEPPKFTENLADRPVACFGGLFGY